MLALQSSKVAAQAFAQQTHQHHQQQPGLHRPMQARSVAMRSSPSSDRSVAVASTSGKATISFLGAGGQKVDVECGLDEYILDAGLEAGLELPYTCRGGICGACVAKVTKGGVDQSDIDDLSFTLSDSEVAEGMALICMARPKGDCTLETQSDWGYSLGIIEWQGATGKILGGKVEPLMGEKWDDIKKQE